MKHYLPHYMIQERDNIQPFSLKKKELIVSVHRPNMS